MGLRSCAGFKYIWYFTATVIVDRRFYSIIAPYQYLYWKLRHILLVLYLALLAGLITCRDTRCVIVDGRWMDQDKRDVDYLGDVRLLYIHKIRWLVALARSEGAGILTLPLSP